MSLNRHAAKRDANEPSIRKRFAHHGWHTEQLSETGMPDLLVWPRFYPVMQEGPRAVLVDVKMPDGKVTPAQQEKWKALAAKGIPVYVVRTAEDVDALVRGDLAAWASRVTERDVINAVKKAVLRSATRARPPLAPKDGMWTPPRSKPVDAAREADETFAIPPRCMLAGCPCFAVDGLFCKDHAP